MTIPYRSVVKEAFKTLIAGVTFPEAVNGKTTWGLVSRRLAMFNKIDAEIQPAAYIVNHREVYRTRYEGVPPKRVMELGVWCFAPTGGDEIIGDQYLDSMMEGIEGIVVVDDVMRNELTLGGLVYSVNIDQESNLFIRDPGDIDGQALLIVPFRIVLP